MSLGNNCPPAQFPRSLSSIDLTPFGPLLVGKIALVPGGTSGIGAVSAIRLARGSGTAIFLEHDVTDESQWESVIQKVQETFGGPLYVLVMIGAEMVIDGGSSL
ncbi:hypothetical protein M427DRAFT_31015 [Gonapodya prolifera JEL478]|uniref:NAD(P)-binding protein n=1 Tax=Gonapodya prolifera (strain JEL478) TaxID=1344416 RepID=A0A139AIG3_GONPJ|nr:hypothetical protein M427DRAFT_31015 [Gonapodya prolifera JEL478]|eukprot:KXS16592.1 hypothetical protein M427DRAFT_31015 [Gonapodya prolifera JEL478]